MRIDARGTLRLLVVGAVMALAVSLQAASDPPIVEAAKKGDLAAVRAQLGQRVDVNTPGLDGSTALLWAANREDAPMVELLLKAGADIKAANRHGVTALSLASLKGSAPVINLLLAAGADPNTALPAGETALMSAARNGRIDAVKTLIDHGANVNAKENVRGQTALMWAAAQGHTEAVQLLLKSGADFKVHALTAPPPTDRLGKPLPEDGAPAGGVAKGKDTAPAESKVAAAPEDGKTIAEAPGRGKPQPPRAPRSTTGGLTAFLFSVRAGHIGAAHALLEYGADVNEKMADGTSALIVAIVNGHYELAKLLLEKGADPNAASQGWTPLIQLLVTRRPSLFRPYPFPVPDVTVSDMDLMAALVEHGADVNAVATKAPRDGIRSIGKKTGGTPFFFAAKGADLEAMKFLVKHGADVFKPNDEGTTPLMAAAGVGIWRIGESPGTNEEALAAVKYIVSLGGDVHTVDENGETAVHGAAHRGSPELIQYLAEQGASLDETNKIGWTPLTIAGGVYYPNLYEHYPEAEAMLKKLGAKAPGTRRPLDAQPQQEGAPVRAPQQ
jgi:ankyrin repeat protein